MTTNLNLSRQRVPMLDASTLEDRTRPAEDIGSARARLSYFQWPSWAAHFDRVPPHQSMPTQARLGRR